MTGAFSIAYVVTALIMLSLDAVWLRLMADMLYRPLLGELLVEPFRIVPAVLFYLIYVGGVVIFAVLPALNSGKWTTALGSGVLLGLVAYGTYDLTNQATLRAWSSVITIADLCWGMTLTGVTAVLAWLVTRLILRALA